MADKQSGTGARGKQQQNPKGNSSTSKGDNRSSRATERSQQVKNQNNSSNRNDAGRQGER